MKILVTGATGYIGGRLVPRLLEAGHEVRVLVRDPGRIEGRGWEGRVEVRVGDLEEPELLENIAEGCGAAYYLVHSMGAGEDFRQRDRRAARHFAEAVGDIGHVIYLGGLVPRRKKGSPHLTSRAEVGKILRVGGRATEFRAGPIIGSGSASFEMVRYLTERLPVMITPRWIDNEVQPVAIRDVLSYLVAALDKGPQGVVPIGANVLTFRDMMMVFAKQRGLKRRIFPSPFLAPRLAARWVGLVTPIPNRLAVPLVEGVVEPLVADTRKARRLFPEVEPISYQQAVRFALEKIERGLVETRWSGALGRGQTFRLTDREGMMREERSLLVQAPPAEVAKSFMSIGGERGWLVWKWAWTLRGLMDLVAGGPGLRRGRRHPSEILAGEALDFWRVEEVDPPRLLRLRAEMKVPGRAWLQWQAIPEGNKTRLVQLALFAPKGLLGFLYWYSLYPFHQFIFSDLIEAIAKDAGPIGRAKKV